MFRVLAFFFCVMSCLDVAALEDPTRPPVLAKKAPQTTRASAPSLQTILVGPERRLAMIDDRLMSVGDRFGAIELLEIARDAVVVRTNNGERMTLTLRSKKILKEAK